MNITLWILQGLLAVHTIMGAVWKLSNPAEKAIPSLKAIPHPVWVSMSIVEIAAAICLILPAFNTSFGILAPIAAIYIAAEMLLFCVVHLSSGEKDHSPVIYWSIVEAVCVFIALGRFLVSPF